MSTERPGEATEAGQNPPQLWLPTPRATRMQWRRTRAIGTPGELFKVILMPMVVAALAIAAISIPLGLVTFVGLPMTAFAIVSVPVIRSRTYNLASPWTLVVLSVFLGMVLRGIYIELEWPDFDTVNQRWLLGRPKEFFTNAALLVVTGLAAFTAGFSVRVTGGFRRLPRFLARDNWSENRLQIAVALSLLVSVVMLVSFVQSTGGFEIDRISAKRTVTGLDIEADYQSYSHLRWLSGFGKSAALMVLAYYGFSRLQITRARGMLLGVLFLNAALLPFYTSSRGSLMLIGIEGVMVWLLAGRRLHLRTFIMSFVVLAIVFQMVTALRGTRDAGFDTAVSSVDIVNVLDPLVVNRNLLDVAITGHIIDAIPGRLDYEYGETLLQAVTGPIPRSLWPQKPIIGTGKLIGANVFGLETAGVPPGLVAEMYWNFALPGVIIGSAVIGFFIRRIYELFRGHFHNRNMVLIYVVSIMPMAWAIMGSEVSKSLFTLSTEGVRMMILIAFVGRPRSMIRR